MNSITAKLTNSHLPLPPSLHPTFSMPISPLSFKTPSSFNKPQHPKPFQTLNFQSFSQHLPFESFSQKPIPINTLKIESFSPNNAPIEAIKFESFSFSHLKTTFIAAVAATALLFSRFTFIAKPALAVALSPSQTVETKNDVEDEEKEREMEEHLGSNPNDINALRDLMEIKIKNNKIDEAMSVVDRLIELDPNEVEWPLLKSHLYIYNGDPESAKNRFNEMISKDPLRLEAYHGLVMAASQNESTAELKEIEEKIEEAMNLARKRDMKYDLKDFQLLIAQVWVIGGKYDEALKVYEELVKDEPRDFRPYLCQGIIYTLLKKNREAEKCFEKYRSLVPEGHPYARYFDDNMIGTKLYAQKLDNERAGMKV